LGQGRGTLRAVSLRGEPTWGGVAAPEHEPETDQVTDSGDAAERSETDPAPAADPTLEDLEHEVYTARDLHGEERGQVRRTLSEARGRMSEGTYRRALMLARDTGLLSIEECLSGAVAMEWEPMPRPEFSLATIEAAVAEQERDESSDTTF
jgi:hypothetical protein